MNQEPGKSDAVAIVGMSCRFAPDLDTPARLWDALLAGHTSVGDMPAKRWDAYGTSGAQALTVLRNTTRVGSYLDDIEGFDADFFGITPKEAAFLDPQQRILLELSWEALCDAGIPPLSLGGTDTGVFVAANSNDYGRRLLEDITLTGAWAVNGTTYYGMANRISYFLDLRGPSMAVDTACAGSMTALHSACQSLLSDEISLALVGGANVMATPALFVALDAAGATSPDGRSKAFAEDADGYGRGEGLCVLALKRYQDAINDGDPVLALVRGSGVFQDGRSEGMMAPNGDAQEHMLLTTYTRAGVDPKSVGYVEAHGTGTKVGDREEARALAAVFGARQVDGAEPCLIGSVKPNIGHTEACSGLAGVLKCVLAIRHGVIPPSLHDEPSRAIDWNQVGLRLVGDATMWPKSDEPRRAGVSSYGVGGSIAHVILEEAPESASLSSEAAVIRKPSSGQIVPLSAQSVSALGELCERVSAWVRSHPQMDLSDITHTLGARRSHLTYRAAISTTSTSELADQLLDLADPDVIVSDGPVKDEPIVWVFSGHGSQWDGMGRRLLDSEPEFARVLESLGSVYEEELGWAPRSLLMDAGPWTSVQVQALTFAMQVGLSAVWRGRGVKPDAIIGHSVGEIAASVCAGAIPLEQAARFACRRAASLEPLQGRGRMVLVNLPMPEVEVLLDGREDVVVAIDASPTQTVVSGDVDAVEALADEFAAGQVGVWTLNSDIAFHSPHVESSLARVGEAAQDLSAGAPDVPLYTTTLDDPRDPALRSGSYWQMNLRSQVRFGAAVSAAIEDGFRLFLEISPHGVLGHSILDCLDEAKQAGHVVASGTRDTDELESLDRGLRDLYVHGGTIDWARFNSGNLVDLPANAWQRKPYWIFEDNPAVSHLGTGHNPDDHSLLGGSISVSGSPTRKVWQTYLDMDTRPYPQDHRVVDVEITPAAVLINTFTQVAGTDKIPGLRNILLRTPLSVTPPRVVQVMQSDDSIRLSTRIAYNSQSNSDDADWITHSTAVLVRDAKVPEMTVDVDALRSRCPDEWDWSRVDDMFCRMGVGGYAFSWDVADLRRNDNEQLAVLQIESDPARDARTWAQVIDGALTISAVLVTPEYAKHQWMSSYIDSIVFDGTPPPRICVHSTRNSKSPQDTVDVKVADEAGRVVCIVQGLKFSAISDIDGEHIGPKDLVHDVAWHNVELDGVSGSRNVDRAVIVGGGDLADWADTALTRSGIQVELVGAPADLTARMIEYADAVIVAPGYGETGAGLAAAAEAATWTVIETAQVLANLGQNTTSRARLWPVTSDVRSGAQDSSLIHSAIWGTGRILAGEYAERWGAVVDVAGGADESMLVSVLNGLVGDEDIVHLDAEGVSVPRLISMERKASEPRVVVRATDTYLVTGGLGALGLLAARWLVDRGARRLVLNSRHGLPPRSSWDDVTDPRVLQQIKAVQELEALGVTVRTLALDIADAEAVARELDSDQLGLPPIRGIIHAAGALHDALLGNLSRELLRDAMSAKAAGAWVLHELFPVGTLDFFVHFSSCGQLARLTGQANYAAANSFINGLAAYRHYRGETSVSLGWTSWNGVGLSEDIESTMLEANSRGLGAVSVDEAIRAWSFADRFAAPYLAILKVHPTAAAASRPPMLRQLESKSDPRGANDIFVAELARMPLGEIGPRVADETQRQVAAELNMDIADIDDRRPLVEIGVDSVMTVALRIRLQHRFGVDLPPNILWAKPTIEALSGYISGLLHERRDAEAEELHEDPDELAIAS